MLLKIVPKYRKRFEKRVETIGKILDALPATFNVLKRETGLTPRTLSNYLKWMLLLCFVRKVGPIYMEDFDDDVQHKVVRVAFEYLVKTPDQFKIVGQGKSLKQLPRGKSLMQLPRVPNPPSRISLFGVGYNDLEDVRGVIFYERSAPDRWQLTARWKDFAVTCKWVQPLLPASLRSMLTAYLTEKWRWKEGKKVYRQSPHANNVNQTCPGTVKRTGSFEVWCETCGQRLTLLKTYKRGNETIRAVPVEDWGGKQPEGFVLQDGNWLEI